MSRELGIRLFEELDSLILIDPHTHINPHRPASSTLADILGYHYYTELAHSAGMPKEAIEASNLGPREKVGRLVENLAPLQNTIQYSWLVEIARTFFGFTDDHVTVQNWERLFEAAEEKMNGPQWLDGGDAGEQIGGGLSDQ